jgi:hypothetical protein
MQKNKFLIIVDIRLLSTLVNLYTMYKETHLYTHKIVL